MESQINSSCNIAKRAQKLTEVAMQLQLLEMQ